ncbi:conjugate transposon protein TraE [Bacteroides xylanisolvens]|mgnify:FL=1|nr:conjugate transposon protein TraE [Bacteroides xylanisolvens]
MFQKTKQLCRKAFGFVNGIPTKVMMFSFMLLSGMVAKAQNSAGDYSAGTSALSTVAEEIAKYVPIMVKLCYAIAGVVAIVGAISVYIAMNNEEQDVKNILVLQNTFEKTRKQMKVNTLSINALSDNLNFPMFAKLILKKT